MKLVERKRTSAVPDSASRFTYGIDFIEDNDVQH
jgi:hypothetical protein